MFEILVITTTIIGVVIIYRLFKATFLLKYAIQLIAVEGLISVVIFNHSSDSYLWSEVGIWLINTILLSFMMYYLYNRYRSQRLYLSYISTQLEALSQGELNGNIILPIKFNDEYMKSVIIQAHGSSNQLKHLFRAVNYSMNDVIQLIDASNSATNNCNFCKNGKKGCNITNQDVCTNYIIDTQHYKTFLVELTEKVDTLNSLLISFRG